MKSPAGSVSRSRWSQRRLGSPFSRGNGLVRAGGLFLSEGETTVTITIMGAIAPFGMEHSRSADFNGDGESWTMDNNIRTSALFRPGLPSGSSLVAPWTSRTGSTNRP